MGCGSSTAAGEEVARAPSKPATVSVDTSGGVPDGRSPLQSPMPAAGSGKTVTTPTSPAKGGRGAISQLGVASSTPVWQAEGDAHADGAAATSSGHDEILNGVSTVVGGVTTGRAAAAPTASSHLDHTTDEVLDTEAVPTVADAGDAGNAIDGEIATEQAASAPAVGGSWAASNRLEGKLEFSAQQVEELAKKHASMDTDSSGALDLTEFRAQLSSLATVSPLLSKRLFAVFDKDNTGSLDWQEFLAGLSGCCSATPEEKMSLCFALYDIDGDGYLTPGELEAMLSAYLIGSAKLAAEACDVLELEELDLDVEFDEDNWDSVQSVLPSGGSPTLSAEKEQELAATIASFTAEIMQADANNDGKLSRDEFVSWAAGGASGAVAADKQLLTKWMKLFSDDLLS